MFSSSRTRSNRDFDSSSSASSPFGTGVTSNPFCSRNRMWGVSRSISSSAHSSRRFGSSRMREEPKRRLLWADDEIDLLTPHIRFLEQKGFEVTPVPNGEDALDELSKSRFDLVLLDENMPGLGGLETLDQIKSRDLAVPVIMVTKSE